jgi:hypothetical protein
MVTVNVTVVLALGSPPDGVLDEEYASAAGRSITAEAAAGYSAMPMTLAAARMRKADVNIGPPVKPGVGSTIGRLLLVTGIVPYVTRVATR